MQSRAARCQQLAALTRALGPWVPRWAPAAPPLLAPRGLGAFGSTTAYAAGPCLGAPSLGSIFSPWHPSASVPAALLPPAGTSRLQGFTGRSLLLFAVAPYFFLYFGWDDIPGTGASIFNHKEKLITVLHILPQECSPLNNSGLLCHQRYNNRCAIKSFFLSFPENKRPPGLVCLCLLPLCSPQSWGRLPRATGGAGGAVPSPSHCWVTLSPPRGATGCGLCLPAAALNDATALPYLSWETNLQSSR